ncbi:glutamate 5-kinase [Chloroherpeton thalassium ATCC 35110]|uniref:Glutamate 5-kinase n=1 Tax=Chloroherpeton thalassium (strain ATCC 35110 / GB-78) TaxID=517418 RepID=B3QRV3_CHLT3|nr:glutamate 5-kinase [Chloroherpeton thalassium]ACF13906.1 glutamate 5-kinase [Chloroherpeton thalassium ATCC 35110]
MSELIYKTIVVKVGTNVLSKPDGLLDEQVMSDLVSQIARMRQSGVNVILVSSGAVGAGRSLVHLSEKTHPVETRQVLSSIGQIRLINTYAKLFNAQNLLCAQILVTKSDFRDRRHYLNMQTCLNALLKQGVIPIVNENDAISVTELMFTDNDELSGLIASMMQAEALLILTNVDGVFDGNFHEGNAQVISEINSKKLDYSKYIKPVKSSFGRGGMLTKCSIAHKLSLMGITVHIANGKKSGILEEILSGVSVGTKFISQKRTSSVKRWMAHAEGYEKGTVFINRGAEAALLSHETATSLLPVGVLRIEGGFKKGDIIKICNEQNATLGYGMAQYDSQKAASLIGQKGQKPLVHYDYLFLKQPEA